MKFILLGLALVLTSCSTFSKKKNRFEAVIVRSHEAAIMSKDGSACYTLSSPEYLKGYYCVTRERKKGEKAGMGL